MGKAKCASIVLAFLSIIICTYAQINFGSNTKVRPGFGRASGGQHGGRQSGGQHGGRQSGGQHSGNQGFGQPLTNFNQQTPRPSPPSSSGGGSIQQGCNCLPQQQCPRGYGQAKTKCVIESSSGGQGICCIDQDADVGTRILGPTQNQAKVIYQQSGDQQVQVSFQEGTATVSRKDQDMQNRKRQGLELKKGTPERSHAYFFKRSKASREMDKMALMMGHASKALAEKERLSSSDCYYGLPKAQLQLLGNTRSSGSSCLGQNVVCGSDTEKYRTVDGTCNNLGKPLIGRASSAFKRVLPSLYDDGIMTPRSKGIDGGPLALARDVSNTVLLDVSKPSSQLAHSVMQMSQFVDHDITHGPFRDMEDNQAFECCRDGVELPNLPEDCFPIHIPSDDKFYFPKRQRCMNFVRTMLAMPKDECFMAPVEQLNEITHWIDGSTIYGSHQEEKDIIVDSNTGFMKTSPNDDLLPILSGRQAECGQRVPGTDCFIAGDTRANEQPGLTVMHTVWVREHNRIATVLRQLNPHWSAGQLYEETRRIVVAQLQHIVYNEWLPTIIGRNQVQRFGMGVLRDGYRRDYDENVDPRMANEFAAAAFRYGHSMIQGVFRFVSSTGRVSSRRLREVFNSPSVIMEEPELIDSFIRGLTSQGMQELDSFITDELSNHLFQAVNESFGMDLMSINIQRGRDHAIATYPQMREYAEYPPTRAFYDLRNVMPEDHIRRLQAVYRNVEDIDAFVGGMLENPLPDGLLGPTFAYIIGDQFQRTQQGDRFFYDRANQPSSFTPGQLYEIRKATLAGIFCHNANIVEMQRDALRLPNDRSNPPTKCDQHPTLNLREWQGERAQDAARL